MWSRIGVVTVEIFGIYLSRKMTPMANPIESAFVKRVELDAN
jgi:hypothetical protein